MKMMMLRRRTNPKTETHTSREPAQWKCKSHVMRKFVKLPNDDLG